MQIIVASVPQPILTAAVVRGRLNISASTTDDTIDALIAAATDVLDGPQGWLGRALGRQTLQLQSEGFYGPLRRYLDDPVIKLLSPPVQSISSVTYVDGAGATQTLDPSAYRLGGRDLSPAYGQSWPSARYQPNAVEVTYVAGYEDGQVPAPILQAIILQVASMNSMMKEDLLSSETVPGVYSRTWESGAGDSYSKSAMALLAPYRVID